MKFAIIYHPKLNVSPQIVLTLADQLEVFRSTESIRNLKRSLNYKLTLR